MSTTPSQTVGPYLAIGLPWPDGPDVVPEGTPGRIRIHGRVFDGAGDPIGDALIETWQADPDGTFGTDFRGFGRCPTDEEGAWEVFTLKPGRVDAASLRSPAIASARFSSTSGTTSAIVASATRSRCRARRSSPRPRSASASL